MWTNIDKKFSTPPPTWRKQRPLPSPMSERKRMSPVKTKDDLFHVIHKVPAGDSPYGRAKHIQLIDKDPSRAVSMFWAAINAGDRVDSALKDMAVVMKQLNRSDEAIEAIKSFRHLCPFDSQESLDNVLIELYKRCGRIEEEIEMLQCKLKNIEEGKAFGGAKTKLARSQGKKIQITVEQERSRILGNLAWAYLQKNEYEIAEQHYRKALSLESDKNKQCNLAICLIHMNRMTEAKTLLQVVKASAGKKQMDESYAKSFERALQMLNELESPSVLEPSDQEEDSNEENQGPFGLTTDLTYGGQNHSSNFNVTRSLADGHDEEIMLLNEQDGAAFCRNHLKNKNRGFGCDKRSLKCILTGPAVTSQFTPHNLFANNWRKGSLLEKQCGRSDYASTIKEHWARSPGIGVSCAQQEAYASPSVDRRNFEVSFTQPRGPSWGLTDGEWRRERGGNGHFLSEKSTVSDNAVLFTQPRISSSYGFKTGDQRRGKWGEKAVCNSIRKLSFEQAITTENVQEKGLPSPTSEDWMMTSLRDIGQVIDEAAIQPPTQPKSSCWGDDGFDRTKDDTEDRSWTCTWQNSDDQKKFALKESNSGTTLPTGPTMVVVDTTAGLKTSFGDQTSEMSDTVYPFIAEKAKSSQDCTIAQGKKSWADMVEEEEKKQESLCDRISKDGLDVWNMEEEKEEEFNDENLNSNVIYPSSCAQNQIDYLSQNLEDSLDLQNGYGTSKSAGVLSKNQTARRSLCFGQYQKPNKGLNSVLLNDKDFMSGKNINMKTRTRLQVFQDITPFPDSP